MSELRLESLSVRAGEAVLVAPLTLSLSAGECVAVLGPNGSGKSSLLRALTGFSGGLDHSVSVEGRIQLNGKDPQTLPTPERARLIAHAEDEIRSDFPFPVREILELARGMSGAASAVVSTAIEDAELGAFLGRDLRTLSGGERQRVLLAMSWIQSPSAYAFDETLSQLDLNHLWRVGAAIRRRARAEGAIVLLVTHEWNFAAQWADRLVVLDGGHCIAEGAPKAILTPELLKRIYPGWSAEVRLDGRPRIDYPGFD